MRGSSPRMTRMCGGWRGCSARVPLLGLRLIGAVPAGLGRIGQVKVDALGEPVIVADRLLGRETAACVKKARASRQCWPR